jgi:hypothetical protein
LREVVFYLLGVYVSSHVTLTLRPLRLAVVADCRSTESLLQAIGVNSMTWGGSLNPLIPYMDAYPEYWRNAVVDKIDSLHTACSLVLDRFDPDRAVVAFDHSVDIPIQQVALEDLLDTGDEPVGRRHIGIDVLEMARLFDYEQLRFTRKNPIRVASVQAEAGVSLLAGLMYGYLPPDVEREFVDIFGDNASIITLTGETLYDPVFDGIVSPRTISQYQLTLSPRASIACLHATDVADVVTLWNAATESEAILPIPVGEPYSAVLLERLLKQLSGRSVDEVRLIRCPSVSNDDLQHVANALSTSSRVVVHDYSYLPPTRFERRASANGTARRTTLRLQETSDSVDIDMIAPRLLPHDGRRYGEPRYINEVEVGVYDGARLPASVLPRGIKRFYARRFPLLDYRVGDFGLCLEAKWREERESVPLPDASAIVRSFFEQHGYETSISAQGLAFQQLLVLTNGATGWLTHPKVRAILDEFDKTDQSDDEFPHDDSARIITWADVKRVVADEPEKSLRLLLDAHLISAGLKLKCEQCGGYALYDPAEIGTESTCKRCQLLFKPPLHLPSDMTTWGYRLLAPFNNAKQRRGLLGMVMALAVLEGSPSDKTIAAGITIKRPNDPNTEIELDLIGLQRPGFDRREIVPLFVEAKYKSDFTQVDVARMASLLEQFPHAVYGFSTVRGVDQIGPHVLRRVRAFSRLKNERRAATHTTMLLTKRELRASFETILDGDHITGYFEEIGRRTCERHLSSPPPSFVAWKAAREADARAHREKKAAKAAKRARDTRQAARKYT